MQKICDGLNGTGQRTVRGNRFTVNSLRNIMMNRAYIGEYRYGEIVIPGGMPRLVDDEVFLAAQTRLEANKCGGTLHGISGTNKKASYILLLLHQPSKTHLILKKSA